MEEDQKVVAWFVREFHSYWLRTEDHRDWGISVSTSCFRGECALMVTSFYPFIMHDPFRLVFLIFQATSPNPQPNLFVWLPFYTSNSLFLTHRWTFHPSSQTHLLAHYPSLSSTCLPFSPPLSVWQTCLLLLYILIMLFLFSACQQWPHAQQKRRLLAFFQWLLEPGSSTYRESLYLTWAGASLITLVGKTNAQWGQCVGGVNGWNCDGICTASLANIAVKL